MGLARTVRHILESCFLVAVLEICAVSSHAPGSVTGRNFPAATVWTRRVISERDARLGPELGGKRPVS